VITSLAMIIAVIIARDYCRDYCRDYARDVIALGVIALSIFDLIVSFRVKMSRVFWEIK
jgi:hypothetical protein